MEYTVEMYETADGKMPVTDFIQTLESKKQAKILRKIDLLEKFGRELHYPHVDTIKGDKYRGLWELRIEFASNIFRIFFFLPKDDNAILLTNGARSRPYLDGHDRASEETKGLIPRSSAAESRRRRRVQGSALRY
jgi:hypothetical protein